MILFALVSLLLLRFSISLYFKSRLSWGITELIQFTWSCIRSLSQKYFWIKHVFGNHTESMKIHGEIFKCCTWLMFGHIKENIAILNQLEKRWGQVESTLRKCVCLEPTWMCNRVGLIWSLNWMKFLKCKQETSPFKGYKNKMWCYG